MLECIALKNNPLSQLYFGISFFQISALFFCRFFRSRQAVGLLHITPIPLMVSGRAQTEGALHLDSSKKHFKHLCFIHSNVQKQELLPFSSLIPCANSQHMLQIAGVQTSANTESENKVCLSKRGFDSGLTGHFCYIYVVISQPFWLSIILAGDIILGK